MVRRSFLNINETSPANYHFQFTTAKPGSDFTEGTCYVSY